MMTNLFSIFDPAVPFIMPINWIAMAAPMVTSSMLICRTLNPFSLITKKMNMTIYQEMGAPLAKMKNFLLLIITLFVFILLNNLSSNLPYIFPATSHISLTAMLSLITWTAIFLFTIFKTTSKTITHLVPMKTPYALIPFMVLIETISMLMRPLTLALRLGINIMTGHLLISLISEAYMSLPSVALPALSAALNPMMMLELAVAVIQAYVFLMLITLYIKEGSH